MPLSADRDTKERGGVDFPVPVAASSTIYAGSLVCADGDGYAVPAAKTAGYRFLGAAQGQVDNSSGSDGDEKVIVRRGREFLFKASGLTQANLGDPAYVSDDETLVAAVTGTAVADEELVADAGGATKVFEGFLANDDITPGSVTISATVSAAGVALADDGKGALVGAGAAGFIDYASGYYQLSYDTAPDDDSAITADYQHSAVMIQAGVFTEILSATSAWVRI